ncbi:MAG: hypothetical protein H8E47_13205 [Anaerolineales bacterium]|nr:hypothetical protein [Anaerolineales bacterium]
MKKKVITLIVLGLLLSFLPACQNQPEGGPLELLYVAPFETGIERGSYLPGTGIRYVGLSDKGAELLIDDQAAFKQKGDSLDWKGNPVGNVELDLSLRVLWVTEETLYVGGTAKATVSGPMPQAASIPTEPPVKYSSAPVTYQVKKGESIPGTLVKYIGKQEEEGIELSGVEGYPYRQLGDSVVWEGKLTEGVFLHLNVRVLFIAEDFINVTGTAALLLSP